MTISSKAEPKRSTRAKKATGGGSAPKPTAKSAVGKRANKSATSLAIATDLAPAVAIALLDKTEHAPGDAAPALECIAAAATNSETVGMVRLQLLFENGAMLPVEMSEEAGEALSKGLSKELPHK